MSLFFGLPRESVSLIMDIIKFYIVHFVDFFLPPFRYSNLAISVQVVGMRKGAKE